MPVNLIDATRVKWNLAGSDLTADTELDAADITFDDAGLVVISAANVQAALEGVDASLDGLSDSISGLDASDIAFDDDGMSVIDALDVEGALADLDGAVDGLMTDVSTLSAADIGFSDSNVSFSAADVQEAIDDLEDIVAGHTTSIGGLLPKAADIQSYAGNRTLDASNLGNYIRITDAGTVTLPNSLATGFQCVIVNATDAATVAVSATGTLVSQPGYEDEILNRGAITVIHVGSNTWEMHGALVPEE